MTPQNSRVRNDSQDRLEIVGGRGYWNTLYPEGTPVPKVRQVDQKSPTKLQTVSLDVLRTKLYLAELSKFPALR